VTGALEADARGDADTAEDQLLNAIAGFKRSLSSTQSRTVRALYTLAAMYANRQQMDQADEALNWLTRETVSRWGHRHHRTMMHFLGVVDLLQSWGRHEHAQLFTYKLLDNWDEIEDGIPPEIPGSGTDISADDLDDLANDQPLIFEESSEAGVIETQLRLANLWSSSSMSGVDQILSRLIAQCERYPDRLEMQAIQARCSLASWHISRGDKRAARPVVKQAWQSLKKQLDAQKKVAHTELSICRRVAFLHREAGRHNTCDEILDHTAQIIERIVLLPTGQQPVDLAISFNISVGQDYQQRSSWNRARPWYERALALVIHERGPFDPLAEKLSITLQEKKFSVTSLGSIDDVLGAYVVSLVGIGGSGR